MKNKIFKPLFKEDLKGNQFIYRDNEWVRSNETQISMQWKYWVTEPNADKQYDDEGFTIFGFNE
jgi:hypothetical protein